MTATYLCASHTQRVEVRRGTPLHVHDASYCDSAWLVGPGGPRLTELVLAAEAAKARHLDAALRRIEGAA